MTLVDLSLVITFDVLRLEQNSGTLWTLCRDQLSISLATVYVNSVITYTTLSLFFGLLVQENEKSAKKKTET